MADGNLSARQSAFVAAYIKGKSAVEAARLSGYAPAYARKAAGFLLTQAPIKAAVDAARKELRQEARYEVIDAMREADSLIAFARENRNPMACAKLLEIKAKMFGLMVDRVDMRLETIDLSDALRQARARAGTYNAQDVEFEVVKRIDKLLVAPDVVDPFS